MTDRNSITVIIPALNEEKRLAPAVDTVSEAVKRYFDDYEIIIFNDGSKDKTGQIAETLASNNPNIRVVHNERPLCVGGIYKEGLRLAAMDYVMLVNGKNDSTVESLSKILALRGEADMIIPYTVNTEDRSMIRRVFSGSFVAILNILFGLDLKYYNHFVLHKREIVNAVRLRTNSYAFQAEILIKLIKSGYDYIEVGILDNFEKDVKTKAFRLKNILEVGLFAARVLYDVYLAKDRNLIKKHS